MTELDARRRAAAEGRLLPLVEDFYTIQGEGFHTGRAAYFVRLAGCDVRCPWCDAAYTWSAERYPLVEVGTIADRVTATPARCVVITGGEPLLHPLGPLTEILRSRGVEILLETSGTQPLSGSFDWICLSPKRHCAPRPELSLQADELKTVVSCDEDFAWAEEQAALVRPDCRLSLQPEWGAAERMTTRIVEYVKAHPRWRISLQTHKYLNIP